MRRASSCARGPRCAWRAARFASALALAACHRSAETSPAAGSAAPAPEPTALPSARRPARRYYLERTPSRCEVYSRDPEGDSPHVQTPCPLELAVGDRIRIVGKTCVHEVLDGSHADPTVCPDPLTNREKRDLAEQAR